MFKWSGQDIPAFQVITHFLSFNPLCPDMSVVAPSLTASPSSEPPPSCLLELRSVKESVCLGLKEQISAQTEKKGEKKKIPAVRRTGRSDKDKANCKANRRATLKGHKAPFFEWLLLSYPWHPGPTLLSSCITGDTQSLSHPHLITFPDP